MRYLMALLAALPTFAQLTPDQKTFDFQSLAGIYAKRYASVDWKLVNFNFDALDISSWLARATATASDLEFYDLMIEYVSNLHDSHDSYHLPSDFVASLGFTVDIYDGRVLIDGIVRTALPIDKYPFVVGDELLAIDGTSVADLIQQFTKYGRNGNDRSTQRTAAARMVTRPQQLMPYAVNLPDSATAQIVHAGVKLDFVMPWRKSGTPLLQVDPVPMPHVMAARTSSIDDPSPLENSLNDGSKGVLGVGSRSPVFSARPAGFLQRLGTGTDTFLSGTFNAGGYRIGFIRIPSYNPTDTNVSLAEFQREIAFLQANTDGLVVDQMHNPGGLLCYGESIVANLIPTNFQPIGYQIRATYEYLQMFGDRLLAAQNAGNATLAAQDQVIYDAVKNAYNGNQRLTDTIPYCTANFNRPPATDNTGKVIAYSKPMILLNDEFTSSTADSVAAMIQDNSRGPLVGWRTNGAGGSNSQNISRFQVGAYSEGDTGVTLSLMVRAKPIVTDDFGTTAYIENVGVRPDLPVDYMTLDNLLNGGRAFVQAFTDAIVKQIRGN